MANFCKGQRIVCIDASPDRFGNDSGLIEGHVYTVALAISTSDGEGVTLNEVPIPHSHKEAWYSRRFRALMEKKTDISVFTKMLNLETV